MNSSLNFAVIHASGDDAETFLQGQLTQDMSFPISEWRYAAQCNPKGRVINFFTMYRHTDGYFLITAQNLVEDAIAQLSKYIMRSKVTLSLMEISGDEDTIVSSLLTTLGIEDSSPLAVHSIKNGVFCLTETTQGEFTPEALNLDLLGAVDFGKGCYTGQEVVARMHYLGKAKKRLHYAKLDSNEAPVLNSSLVNSEEKTVGTLVDCQQNSDANGWDILAILNTDVQTGTVTIKESTTELQEIQPLN